RVVARLAIGQARVGQKVHHVRNAPEGYEVILNVLTRSEVALAAAEFLGHTRELLRLRRGHEPARYFAPDHLHALLPLSVDAVFQAKRPKLALGNLARQERVGLLSEYFDFLADRLFVLPLELFPSCEGF